MRHGGGGWSTPLVARLLVFLLAIYTPLACVYASDVGMAVRRRHGHSTTTTTTWRGTCLVAHQDRILTCDGELWHAIPQAGTIYTMHADDSYVYVGAARGLYTLRPPAQGVWVTQIPRVRTMATIPSSASTLVLASTNTSGLVRYDADLHTLFPWSPELAGRIDMLHNNKTHLTVRGDLQLYTHNMKEAYYTNGTWYPRLGEMPHVLQTLATEPGRRPRPSHQVIGLSIAMGLATMAALSLIAAGVGYLCHVLSMHASVTT